MARPRQPVDLLVFKGKKNLTKKEIEERKSQEVKAGNDKVKAPAYLPKELKKEFKKISDELIKIGIMTNLDVDALSRFLLAKKMYLDVTESMLKMPPVHYEEKTDSHTSNSEYADLLISQDKLFKQCRAAASDLGLTISSRARLVMPKGKDDDKPKTDGEKRFGDRL
jgi:P27 family predicted phage terminase small subunit